ncbi:hypothetical protein [Aureimonas sp. OT7]|uniref:hypothetical protein n=1 Tax=Aureimonas sp. OT7 TaxID=2816454 RepID=UPI0032B1E62C
MRDAALQQEPVAHTFHRQHKEKAMKLRHHLRRLVVRTGDIEESYLNEATSLADLEIRQREIDRGRFRR